MENRLKERLTGAAILVALIVLIVPEMFHGQRAPPPHSAGPEGAPERSFTIELDNSSARAPDRVSTPAPPPGQTTPTPTPTPTPAPTAAPASTAASGTSAAVFKASSAAAVSSRSHAVFARDGWTLQLGLFAKSANAQRLLHTAQSRGFAPRVSRYGSKGLYRVAIAGVPDRAGAEQLSRRLRAAGLSAAIIGPR